MQSFDEIRTAAAEQEPYFLNGDEVLMTMPFSIERDTSTVTYIVLVQRTNDFVVATYNRNTKPGWVSGHYITDEVEAERRFDEISKTNIMNHNLRDWHKAMFDAWTAEQAAAAN